jgi:hypothetical protein
MKNPKALMRRLGRKGKRSHLVVGSGSCEVVSGACEVARVLDGTTATLVGEGAFSEVLGSAATVVLGSGAWEVVEGCSSWAVVLGPSWTDVGAGADAVDWAVVDVGSTNVGWGWEEAGVCSATEVEVSAGGGEEGSDWVEEGWGSAADVEGASGAGVLVAWAGVVGSWSSSTLEGLGADASVEVAAAEVTLKEGEDKRKMDLVRLDEANERKGSWSLQFAWRGSSYNEGPEEVGISVWRGYVVDFQGRPSPQGLPLRWSLLPFSDKPAWLDLDGDHSPSVGLAAAVLAAALSSISCLFQSSLSASSRSWIPLLPSSSSPGVMSVLVSIGAASVDERTASRRGRVRVGIMMKGEGGCQEEEGRRKLYGHLSCSTCAQQRRPWTCSLHNGERTRQYSGVCMMKLPIGKMFRAKGRASRMLLREVLPSSSEIDRMNMHVKRRRSKQERRRAEAI